MTEIEREDWLIILRVWIEPIFHMLIDRLARLISELFHL